MLALSRWPGFAPDPDLTPEEFYVRLFAELKDQLEAKPLPFSQVGFGPKHLFARRTAFSARPVYLTLRYREFTYYVHAMPAPGGLAVTSWFYSRYTLWEEHPVLRWILIWRQFQQTLFQFDSMDLFHDFALTTVQSVVESYREEQGLAPMTEEERRPILQSYFARFKEGTQPRMGFATPVGQSAPAPQAPSGLPPAKERSMEAPPMTGVLPNQSDPLPQTSS